MDDTIKDIYAKISESDQFTCSKNQDDTWCV